MSSEDEFMDEPRAKMQEHDNPLAWGKKKENFYKDSESEYSEVEEEQKQADEIYNKQLENIDQDDYALHKIAAEEVSEDEHQGINYKTEMGAITKQLKKVLKHSRRIEQLSQIPGANSLFTKGNMSFVSCCHTINEAYMMCLLMLLQMYKNRMLQLDKHPIMARLAELRELYLESRKQFVRMQPRLAGLLKRQIEQEEEEWNGQDQGSHEEHKVKGENKNGKKADKGKSKHVEAVEKYLDDQGDNNQPAPKIKPPKKIVVQEDDDVDYFGQEGDDLIEQGLNKYEEEAQKQKTIRKKIKKQNREKYLQNIPKQAFETVRQNQARSINYTILKNRGLTRRRTNQPKGSRLKLRRKFEKAEHKIRSKGKVIYQNPGRVYQGEANIKSHKLTGVKIK